MEERPTWPDLTTANWNTLLSQEQPFDLGTPLTVEASFLRLSPLGDYGSTEKTHVFNSFNGRSLGWPAFLITFTFFCVFPSHQWIHGLVALASERGGCSWLRMIIGLTRGGGSIVPAFGSLYHLLYRTMVALVCDKKCEWLIKTCV